jgi:hypothetical protein
MLEDGHSVPISYRKATETRYLGDTGFIRPVLSENIQVGIRLANSVKLTPMGISPSLQSHEMTKNPSLRGVTPDSPAASFNKSGI